MLNVVRGSVTPLHLKIKPSGETLIPEGRGKGEGGLQMPGTPWRNELIIWKIPTATFSFDYLENT